MAGTLVLLSIVNWLHLLATVTWIGGIIIKLWCCYHGRISSTLDGDIQKALSVI